MIPVRERCFLMFEGFDSEMIPFFLDLRYHNNKAFMDENRERYLTHVRGPFCDFIDALGPKLQKEIPDLEIRPAKCLSRINRDIRFSRDKSPYRDHLWISFRRSAAEKDGLPFFWFEISPEDVSWGMGVWGENPAIMDALRRKIIAFPARVEALLPTRDNTDLRLSGRDWMRITVPDGVPDSLRPVYVKRSLYFERVNTRLDWIYSRRILSRVYRDYMVLLPFYQLLTGLLPDGASA